MRTKTHNSDIPANASHQTKSDTLGKPTPNGYSHSGASKAKQKIKTKNKNSEENYPVLNNIQIKTCSSVYNIPVKSIPLVAIQGLDKYYRNYLKEVVENGIGCIEIDVKPSDSELVVPTVIGQSPYNLKKALDLVMDVYVAHRPARTEENSSRFLIIDLTLHTEKLTNAQTKYLVDCLQTLYDGSCKQDKGVTIWNKGLINVEKTNVGMINGFVLFKIKSQKLHPSHLPTLQPFIAFDKSLPNGTCTTFTAATASASIPESPPLDKHQKSEKVGGGKLYRVSPPYIGMIGKDAGVFMDGGYHFVPLDFGNDEHRLLASMAFPGKSGWKIFEEPEEDSDDSDEEEEEEEEKEKEEKKEEEQQQEEQNEENNDNQEEAKDSDTQSNSSAGSNDSDNCVIS